MVGRTEKWIATLLDGLDKHVDEKTIAKILEQCGRQCQTQRSIQQAKSLYKDSENNRDFLEKYGKVNKHLHVENGKAYLIYNKCYCSQVNKIPKGQLSGKYCNCSRGWAKALFEGATGKPVEVTMEKSIVNGDDHCRFRIGL